MHPFKSWLIESKHPMPHITSSNLIDWIDLGGNMNFSHFIFKNNLRLPSVNRLNIKNNKEAPASLIELYVKQFDGIPLQTLPFLHTPKDLRVAELKRLEILQECDDLLCFMMCNTDYIMQAQFWHQRIKASKNEILINIASISLANMTYSRLHNGTLDQSALDILNNDVPVDRNDQQTISRLKDKVLFLISLLVHFELITYAKLTDEEIANPEIYLDRIAKERILFS